MIIDDSLLVRKILEISLRRAGLLNLISFPDCSEALRAINSNTENTPGVIVLDLYLPDMNGFALARLIRSSPLFDKTKIIILTGYDSFLNQLRAKITKADYYTKPFKTKEIIAAILRYLNASDDLDKPSEHIQKGEQYALATDYSIIPDH